MGVHFFNADISYSLKNKRKVGAIIDTIFKDYQLSASSISIVFCSDEYLLTINRHHLNHDFYTDIVTFDLSPTVNECVGELYISIDRVRDNATQFKIPFVKELHRVIFHGCLHLCGLKDKKKAEVIMMRRAEDKYLGLYFN